MEYHLEEDIAQFLRHVDLVVRLRGVNVFVGFFDKIRQQGLVRLLTVPRAPFGRTEGGHDIQQVLKGVFHDPQR